MSLNLILSTSNKKCDLYQTPTEISRECMRAGSTAGILAKYIEYLGTNLEVWLREPNSFSEKDISERACELMLKNDLDYREAYKLSKQQLKDERIAYMDEHINNVKNFITENPTASFDML